MTGLPDPPQKVRDAIVAVLRDLSKEAESVADKISGTYHFESALDFLDADIIVAVLRAARAKIADRKDNEARSFQNTQDHAEAAIDAIGFVISGRTGREG